MGRVSAVGIVAILAEAIRKSGALGCGCCSGIECAEPSCWDEEYQFFDHYGDDCLKSEDRDQFIAKVVIKRLQEEEIIQ